MASTTLIVAFLLVSFSLLALSPSVSSERNHHKECQQRCQRDYPHDERERWMCERRCEEASQEDESWASIFLPERDPRKECECQCDRRGAGRSEKWKEECRCRCDEEASAGGGGRGRQNPHRECWERCRRECHDEKELRRCERMCEKEAERGRHGLEIGAMKKGEGEGKKEKRDNPYIWRKGEFQTKYKSEGGSCEMLPNFAEKSNILKGLENYRMEKVVANPSTVVVPHHMDADSILYVCNGRGIIGALDKEKQETFEVSEGDVMVVPAGTTCFAANTDEREQLCLISLFHTISSPGKVEAFFGIGAEDQQSFFQTFSSEILEAAFNTGIDNLKRLFSGRRQVMFKASREQIRELSRSTSEGGASVWPFANDHENCHRPYNVLKKSPWFSSRRGRICRVDHNDYAPLGCHDIAVSFANVSGGSMLVPAINSRATKIAVVLKGTGVIETACPHLSTQQKGEEERQGTRYQKVSAELKPLTVFIVPAGHPSAIIANEDLHVMCFDVNYRGNQRYMLAGKNNIYNNLKGVAGELAFGAPTKERERILGAQQEEVIVAGPKERREGGRGGSKGYEVA